MIKLKGALTICFMACVCHIGLHTGPCSAGSDVNITWRGEAVSADLTRVPLQDVFDKLQRDKDVWFKVPESLLQKEISVHFRNLPFEEALKRLLAPVDYSLAFDRKGRLVGAIVLGEKQLVHVLAKSPVGTDREAGPFPRGQECANLEDPAAAINTPFPSSPSTIDAEELEKFKVVRNCPPPGGPVQVTEEDLEMFKVVKNCEPPGGP